MENHPLRKQLIDKPPTLEQAAAEALVLINQTLAFRGRPEHLETLRSACTKLAVALYLHVGGDVAVGNGPDQILAQEVLDANPEIKAKTMKLWGGQPGMLIIFDKDGTLVQDYGNRPANSVAEQVFYPGVVTYLSRLSYYYGYRFGLASNQGGVAYGFITENEAIAMVEHVASEISGVSFWEYCPHHPKGTVAEYAIDCECRKPKAGMINRIIEDASDMYQIDYRKEQRHKVLFVGDQPTDKAAAEAAGVEFMWAHEFFPGLVPPRPDFSQKPKPAANFDADWMPGHPDQKGDS